MAKFLRDLLGAKEPLFSESLKQLEKASGRKGIDTKLIGDIIEKSHKKIRDLGLDIKDTTGLELYHALISKIKDHDNILLKILHADSSSSPYDCLKSVADYINTEIKPNSVWVIKKSVAKSLLRQSPPTKLMDKLGYRSVDSMLKKENILEIYSALRFIESKNWLKKFIKNYDTLQPTDFEKRKIEILILPKDYWSASVEDYFKNSSHNIVNLKELGAISILPLPYDHIEGVAIWSMALILHYINELSLYSSFFKLKQVNKSFGKIIADTILDDPSVKELMAGQDIHWRVVQRHFGRLDPEYHPEVFEPHLQPEDLYWRNAERQMCKIEPELDFWKNSEYVGTCIDGQVISFNMMDTARAYYNLIQYKDRPTYYFRDSLWNEIYSRYLGEKILKDQVINQLTK